MSKFLTIETRSGQPIQAGDATLTPFAQSWQVRFPNQSGGLVWNRPVSVLVTSANGQEQVLPVTDITRLALWALMGGCALTVMILSLALRKSNK